MTNTEKQTEALRLATLLEQGRWLPVGNGSPIDEAAAELRRLDSENKALRERLEINPSHPIDGIEARDETIRQQDRIIERLRGLAATCYAGLGAECNLPENWLDALNAAASGEAFNTEGLLPFTAATVAERDAAFEAVRQRLCKLPKYSFVLADGEGGVSGVARRKDGAGRWIEFQAAHELFDPVAVDAALAAQAATKNGDAP